VYLGKMDSRRRSVITWIGKGLAALGGAGGLLLAGRFVQPYPRRDRSREVELGPAADLPQGAVRHLPDADVYVIHGVGGIYAVSGRCTHLGCSVAHRPSGFDCPCHGARFDLEGQPVSGPATRPLRWLRLALRGQSLVLELDHTVPPGTMKRI
jgi:cytochrome b6-f complex iron-sulfur subunit